MRKIGSYIGRGVRSISETLNPFGGAVDIIVVKQPDGSLKSSPWYVRFGKFQGVLKEQDNVVNVSVNGVESGFNMNIDSRGQATFLRELDRGDGDSLITRTSEQLASLNLKEGKNVVVFMCSTQQVDARIYLWRWDTKIVVSDVDGTITRSDVLGQFMPLVGKDWSHTGVTQLFSAIKENGYQLLFQSARSISQAYLTRQFLFNLMQDGKGLPEGPVLTSPDGLFRSLFREVVTRSPHEFKITCLQDVKSLFPSDRNPFYAGFGNRDTDKVSYLKVGIPEGKIFTIDPKGQIVMNHIDTKSYTYIHRCVDDMFPSLSSSEQICYGQSIITKRSGMKEDPRLPGGLPGVPPGARFDPYGPPSVPGFEPGRFIRDPRSPGSGRPHPDLPHFGGDGDFI